MLLDSFPIAGLKRAAALTSGRAVTEGAGGLRCLRDAGETLPPELLRAINDDGAVH